MEKEIPQMTQRQLGKHEVESMLAVKMLQKAGTWDQLGCSSGSLASALQELVPKGQDAQDVCHRLVNALEGIAGRVAKESILLAVICADLRRLSGLTLARVSRLIAEGLDRTFEVYQMSRMIMVGELVSDYPVLLDIPSFYRLLALSKVPEENRAEAFAAGLLGRVDIRAASRDEIEAAIALLNGETENELEGRVLKRDLTRTRSAIAKVLKALYSSGAHQELLGPLEVAMLAMQTVLEPSGLEAVSSPMVRPTEPLPQAVNG